MLKNNIKLESFKTIFKNCIIYFYASQSNCHLESHYHNPNSQNLICSKTLQVLSQEPWELSNSQPHHQIDTGIYGIVCASFHASPLVPEIKADYYSYLIYLPSIKVT